VREMLEAVALARQHALGSTDQLLVDAVDAKTRHDFLAAIAAYQKLVDQAGPAEKANAYINLGRAFERNEELNKALENYMKATNGDVQSVGGFLRLGVAYGRVRDTKNAEAAFDRSEQIFGVLANPEGSMEVIFQRGVVLYGAGKLEEAKAEFQKSLDMLK